MTTYHPRTACLLVLVLQILSACHTDDPEYDQEKAQKRHDIIVNELLPKLEQKRKEILSVEFEPDDDWWASKVTVD